MLPLKINCIDTRHSTADAKSTSDFKLILPSNISVLSSNTAFYITDFTVHASWYTVEAWKTIQYTS